MQSVAAVVQEVIHRTTGVVRDRVVLDAVPDMIFLLDGEGKYLDFFPAKDIEPFVPPAEFLGRTILEVLPPVAAEPLMQKIKEALRHDRVQAQEFNLPSGNVMRALESRIVPYGPDKVLLIVRDITERQRMIRTLSEKESRLQTLLDTAAQTILTVDRAGQIVMANRMAKEMFGYASTELVGQPLEVLLPHQLRQKHVAHHAAFFAEPRSRPMGTDLALFGRRRNGEEFPVEVSLSYFETTDGLLAVSFISDITERQAADEALRESEERFRLAFEEGPVGMVIVGLDNRLQKVNKAFCELLGYTAGELRGRTLADITHPEDIEGDEKLAAGLFQGEIPNYSLEQRYITKTGQIVWGDLSAAVVRSPEGAALYGLGLVEDITERKRVEMTLKAVSEGTSSAIGEDFFHSLVRHLANILQVDFAFVSELVDRSSSRLRLLSIWADGGHGETFEYETEGTPCEHVMREQLAYHREGVRGLFPNDPWLQDNSVDSYFAMPLFDSSGQPVGHMGVMDREPMHEILPIEPILKIFAARAGAELERKEVEQALREKERRSGAVAGIIEGQEEERRRIARELHDDVNQQLAMLAVELGMLAKEFPESGDTIRGQLGGLQQRTIEISDQVRHMSHALHPAALEHLGLVSAIKSHSAEINERGDISVRLILRDEPGSVPPDVALCLYRVMQECLRNVTKHSGVQEAEVTLYGSPGSISLLVRDQGAGFDPDLVKGKKCLGLVSMEERVRRLDGSIFVRSQPGQGTEVEICLPVPEKAS